MHCISSADLQCLFWEEHMIITMLMMFEIVTLWISGSDVYYDVLYIQYCCEHCMIKREKCNGKFYHYTTLYIISAYVYYFCLCTCQNYIMATNLRLCWSPPTKTSKKPSACVWVLSPGILLFTQFTHIVHIHTHTHSSHKHTRSSTIHTHKHLFSAST